MLARFVIIALVTLALLPTSATAGSLSGRVFDEESEEPLPFANVVVRGGDVELGTSTDAQGAYTIVRIPGGTYALEASFVGYDSHRDTLALAAGDSLQLDVYLEPAPIEGEVIRVEADRLSEEVTLQPGLIGLDVVRLQQLPSVGEGDVLRSLQLLPGVQASSDVSSGLYIRGGGPDQNLILLDRVPLYNPTHAFGFFSTFNPDAVGDVTLHKGTYPAQYGGRLGSVLDVQNRDGSRTDLKATGGISLISGRLTLEGPVSKGTWMLSGRRTYLEPILSAIRNDSTDVPTYYFYDLNGKVTQDLSRKDRLTVSGYFGRDDLGFDLEGDTFFNIRWGNAAWNAEWRRRYAPGLFGTVTVFGSHYTSTTSASFFDTPVAITNSILDLTVRADVDYVSGGNHTLKAGIMASRYDIEYRQEFNQDEQLNLRTRPYLLSIYGKDLWQPRPGSRIRFGVRASTFSLGNRVEVEPRVSASQEISSGVTCRLGGGIYHQHLQLVSTEGFSGSDFWVPLDETVESGRSWQGSAGVLWEPSERYQVTIEGYYTDLDNLVVLDNRVAVDSESTDSESVFVSGGGGYATGVEIFLQRRTGALTGWLGYTLGWTRRQFAELNGGDWFSPKYDRRHDLSFVADYRLGKWSFGASLVYGTGQAFTPASARYTLRSPGSGEFLRDDFVLPAERNSARLLPYHRLDLSVKRRFGLFGTEAEWYVQVFNVYNRRNEWFVQYDTDSPETDPKVVKMLPVVPTLGINFKL